MVIMNQRNNDKKHELKDLFTIDELINVAVSKFIKDDEVCFNSGLYMCTLCGLCTLNCPVSIPTNEILENIRKSAVDLGFYPKAHGKIKKKISKNDSPY